MNKRKRDVEKDYPLDQFVEKLRRLADAIEKGERFEIQIAGERVYVPVRATFNIEHERGDGEEEIEFQIVGSEITDLHFKRGSRSASPRRGSGRVLGGRVTGPACQYDHHRAFCR
ncbi:MAG: amphi-Trp domain-containing protein [Rhizobiales bacterium]|nr:amphi-Trp domain-containing protein [Hyphomicrobiales bacterium]